MSILVNEQTRVLIQGATGRQGRYHTLKMLEYNVAVSGGVTPGRGGQDVHGVPVFDTVAEAKERVEFNSTMILTPPAQVLPAAMEAIENKIPLIVIITELVPLHDTLKIRCAAKAENLRVVGPNTIGVISPGKSKVGIMPGFIYSLGPVGIVSRSGTLTHEIASNLTYSGIGQSSCVCIGGDAVCGTDFVDVLELFRCDEQTESVILIGEIGGACEEIAAEYVRETDYPKRIFAFVAGATAPHGKRMGHAGAIVSGGLGSAQSKLESLTAAGVTVLEGLDELLDRVKG